MEKAKTQKLFDGFFESRKKLLKHFGAKRMNHWDYAFGQNNDEWAICGSYIVWGPGENLDGSPIPLSIHECAYSQQIDAVYRQEHFTLVFMRLEMGGSDAATIFDNEKEQEPSDED